MPKKIKISNLKSAVVSTVTFAEICMDGLETPTTLTCIHCGADILKLEEGFWEKYGGQPDYGYSETEKILITCKGTYYNKSCNTNYLIILGSYGG